MDPLFRVLNITNSKSHNPVVQAMRKSMSRQPATRRFWPSPNSRDRNYPRVPTLLTMSLASTSAPCSRSSWQISVFPSWAATCRGVLSTCRHRSAGL